MQCPLNKVQFYFLLSRRTRSLAVWELEVMRQSCIDSSIDSRVQPHNLWGQKSDKNRDWMQLAAERSIQCQVSPAGENATSCLFFLSLVLTKEIWVWSRGHDYLSKIHISHSDLVCYSILFKVACFLFIWNIYCIYNFSFGDIPRWPKYNGMWRIKESKCPGFGSG